MKGGLALAAAIGAVNGYLVGSDITTLLIGAAVGIIIAFVSAFGFIPFLGVLLYHVVATMVVFPMVGLDLTIVYLLGLVYSLIATLLAVVVILAAAVG